MKQPNHNAHQGLTFDDANRISSLTDRRFLDFLYHRVLRTAGSGAKLLDDESGFFPLLDCKVVVGSGGDRDAGFGLKITAGLGIKKRSAADQPDADLPNFEPIFLSADQAFTTAASDPALPRMDRVYLKATSSTSNPQTVKIIDPVTPHAITDETRDIDLDYGYTHAYAVGTPDAGAAGGAGAPSPPVGFTANDKIADVLVLAGSGTIDPAQITDTRTLFEVDPNLIAGVTSLAAANVTVSPTVLGQADAQNALESLETQIGASLPVGHLEASFEYVQTNQVKLAPGRDGKLQVEIKGVMLERTTDLIFELGDSGVGGSVLDVGLEAADTIYYLYVQDVASTITPHLSVTAPDASGAGRGYHPTNTTWLCVGHLLNDASENIVPFTASAGRIKFRGYVPVLRQELTTGAVAVAWTSQALTIAKTCPFVVCQSVLDGDDAVLCFGASDASVALPATITGVDIFDDAGLVDVDHVNAVSTSGTADAWSGADEFVLAIANMAAPAIKWGITHIGGSADVGINQFRVVEVFDLYAPRSL